MRQTGGHWTLKPEPQQSRNCSRSKNLPMHFFIGKDISRQSGSVFVRSRMVIGVDAGGSLKQSPVAGMNAVQDTMVLILSVVTLAPSPCMVLGSPMLRVQPRTQGII